MLDFRAGKEFYMFGEGTDGEVSSMVLHWRLIWDNGVVVVGWRTIVTCECGAGWRAAGTNKEMDVILYCGRAFTNVGVVLEALLSTTV
jgi:hypothetical protein